MIGTTVSRYTIVASLGGGGMGVVYKAEDPRLKRFVALKFLPPELTSDPTAKARFLREAQTASALDHPNVCTIHEIDETPDGTVFISMAYCEGESLRERLSRGPLSATDAVAVAEQVAAGLAAAHERGIVHRDIKPANVMLTRDAGVKIVDFGLAILTGQARLTEDGLVVGTAGYISPEQARGGTVDHRTDLWSLGVVLYEMLTGRLPFVRSHAPAVVHAILHESVPPISRVRPDVPREVAAIVSRCLAKDPGRRYQSAAALAVDLERVRRVGGTATALARTVSSQASVTSRLVRSRWAWAAVGVGAAAAILALSGTLGALRTRLRGAPLPAERHVAVLEFTNVGGDPVNRAFCDGIAEVLASTLTQLEQFQGALWVVPMSEVRAKGVRSPSDARRVFGANLVVTGGVQREAGRIRLALNLVDAKTLRQKQSRVIDERLANLVSAEDRGVAALADMLDVEMHPAARGAVAAGGTLSPEAYDLYLQARGTLESQQGPPDPATAADLFRRALAIDPTFALAHSGLAEACLGAYAAEKRVEFIDQAVASCAQAIRLNDRLAPGHVTFGLVHSALGRYEEAIAEFQRALQLDPRSAAAYAGLARAEEAVGRTSQAEAAYRRAVALRPGYWPAHNALGGFYYRNGRYRDAEEQFRTVVELTPENFWGYNNLGGLYLLLDRRGDALAMYEKALALKPNQNTFSNVGALHFQDGRFREAAQAYEHALALDDHDYRVWGNLATAYLLLDEERGKIAAAFRKAAALAEQESRVNPRDLQVLADLAGYCGLLGDRDRGLALLAVVIAQSPSEAELLATVGESYEDCGQRDRAIEWLARAIQAGYPRSRLENSPALAELRRDPQFTRMLNESTQQR